MSKMLKLLMKYCFKIDNYSFLQINFSVQYLEEERVF